MTRFMIQSDDPHLFSPKLISRHVQAQLSDGYTLRPLRRDDFSKGFIQVLSQLSITGDISEEQFLARFDLMKRQGTFFVICIEAEGAIVACATLIVEFKFLHACGQIGHIEDVVVSDTQRGKRLGARLVEQLTHMAQQLDCYKTILNCSEHNVAFYEKCGMKRTDVQMTRYFNRQE
ncbi:hypothetical protein VTP01DRAFT_6239 [Rhizomucor pusillus]|uniref:uncharacterized protein n=1 Tax=Rhizomucor pusillus TaxID=4840 RepID=UPI0037421453